MFLAGMQMSAAAATACIPAFCLGYRQIKINGTGRTNMSKVLRWSSVNREKWTHQLEEKECSVIVYKVTRLPDFTEQRFVYLCKEEDNRAAEVAKKQQQMLRQFYGMGKDWTFSMRLLKKSVLHFI